MDAEASAQQEPQHRWKDTVAVLVGLGLAAVLGVGVWLLFRGDSGADGAPATAPFGPAIVDEATLRSETARVGHTVFWFDPEDQVLELTIVEDGTVHVRYLPPGSTEPDPGAPHTTVSSWPMPDPLANAQQSAASDGALSQEASGGALYVTSSDTPYNAYVAVPNATALGEVYDLKAGKAWRDVTEGRVLVLQP